MPEQLYESIIEVRERLVLSGSESGESHSEVPVVTGINGEKVRM